MANAIGSLLRKASNPKRLRAISFSTHERYQQNMAKCNVDFFLFNGPNIKTWEPKYAPLPKNHFLMDARLGGNQIPVDLEFDFILSQNKFGQFPVAQELSKLLHLPLISLEHCLPTPGTNVHQQREWHKSMRGDLNLFISDYSAREWSWENGDFQTIHHGVNTELFCPSNVEREAVVFSCVNDWISRDVYCNYYGWKRITEGHLKTKVLGETKGLSQAAPSTKVLVSAYNSSEVFLNTSLFSPIPSVLLEAMSCECACVSTNNCMIGEIIEHGKNGFLSNDEKELRGYCKMLLSDKVLARKVGAAARQTILDRFSQEKFVKNWNLHFDSLRDFVYKG